MNYLVMPLSVFRGLSFTDYVFIPSPDSDLGQDLTDYTLLAEVRDRPGGTLLATFSLTKDTAPPGVQNGAGWVQIYLDDTDTTAIPAAYSRGTWSLLAGLSGVNPEVIAAGSVEILQSATTWV